MFVKRPLPPVVCQMEMLDIGRRPRKEVTKREQPLPPRALMRNSTYGRNPDTAPDQSERATFQTPMSAAPSHRRVDVFMCFDGPLTTQNWAMVRRSARAKSGEWAGQRRARRWVRTVLPAGGHAGRKWKYDNIKTPVCPSSFLKNTTDRHWNLV